MKQLVVIIILLLSFLFAGCAQRVVIINPTRHAMSEPPLNHSTTVKFQGEIILKGTYYLGNMLLFYQGSNDGIVSEGRYREIGVTDDNKFLVYVPDKKSKGFIKPFIGKGSRVVDDGVLMRDVKSGDIRLGSVIWRSSKDESQSTYGVKDGKVEFITKEVVAHKKMYNLLEWIVPVPWEKSFIKHLRYLGMEGNNIKFQYMTEDLDFPPIRIHYNIIYDLSKGDEITLKTAKFKVIKATKESITYILLKDFD